MYAADVVEIVWPRAGVAPAIVDAIDEQARRRIGVQRDRDRSSATRMHRERAVVERGLAVGELIVGGERIAVEVRARRLRAADVGVARCR